MKQFFDACQMISDMIESSHISKAYVAEKLGMSAPSFCNKLRRKTLSADEFLTVIDSLEYDFCTKDRKSGATIEKKVGNRINMVVDGIRYDTAQADALGHTDETEATFEELYRDAEGRYFMAHYCNWDSGVDSVSPIPENAALAFIRKYL